MAGLNGTVDDFFVGNGISFYQHYHNGTWTPSPRSAGYTRATSLSLGRLGRSTHEVDVAEPALILRRTQDLVGLRLA